MNIYRWTSLFRGYDLSLRHNRWIAALTAVGVALGFAFADGDFAARTLQGLAGGAMVFGAGAVAKEIAPDMPQVGLPAALIAFPFAAAVPITGLVPLFWLLGCLRFLNRATGLPPQSSDTLILLLVGSALAWRVAPLFGLLTGVMLALDGLLPDGRRLHLLLGAIIAVVAAVLLPGDGSPVAPPLLIGAILLIIAVGFIPFILNAYRTTAVGDATNEPLHSLRVQAAQSFALSTGLFAASWLGQAGVLLLIGLWAALVAVPVHYLLFIRSRRSALSL